MSDGDFPFEVETRLLRWGESSTSGRYITLELPPEDGAAHPFRGFPTGHKSGQRFRLRFDVIQDDETVCDAAIDEAVRREHRREAQKEAYRHKTPAERAVTKAAIFCRDPQFWRFLTERGWRCACELDAIDYLKDRCNIAHRGGLAHNDTARAAFDAIATEFDLWRGAMPEPMS